MHVVRGAPACLSVKGSYIGLAFVRGEGRRGETQPRAVGFCERASIAPFVRDVTSSDVA